MMNIEKVWIWMELTVLFRHTPGGAEQSVFYSQYHRWLSIHCDSWHLIPYSASGFTFSDNEISAQYKYYYFKFPCKIKI